MQTKSHDVTRLLAEAGHGDRVAWEQLAPRVYEELHQLAESALRRERAGHTLQPTALVHEAFIKLAGQDHASWENRRHFYGAAAVVMRRVLVNHALARKAAKRGGGQSPCELDSTLVAFEDRSTDLLALDEALKRLAEMDPQQGRIVELRFFGGLSFPEVAELLEVSLSTVERSWRVARAWLLMEITG
jgi:RNA polymerase sigma-70 factor, ECF subfamily